MGRLGHPSRRPQAGLVDSGRRRRLGGAHGRPVRARDRSVSGVYTAPTPGPGHLARRRASVRLGAVALQADATPGGPGAPGRDRRGHPGRAGLVRGPPPSVPRHVVPGRVPGRGRAGCLLVAVLVHPGTPGARALLGSRPLLWLGRRSYGIYLFYWPVRCSPAPTTTSRSRETRCWPSGRASPSFSPPSPTGSSRCRSARAPSGASGGTCATAAPSGSAGAGRGPRHGAEWSPWPSSRWAPHWW